MIEIEQLDHLVLTVRDIDVSCEFYTQVLGMQRIHFGAGRTALKFGRQKINLHLYRQEFPPCAATPTPGSADLCFITRTPLDEVARHIQSCDVPIEEGPIRRSGANGPILSLYVRDPDGNLLEIANQE